MLQAKERQSVTEVTRSCSLIANGWRLRFQNRILVRDFFWLMSPLEVTMKRSKDSGMHGTLYKTGVCLLACLVMIGFAAPCRAADLSAGETNSSMVVAQYLHDWTITGYASAYKDITATVDVSSLSAADAQITAEALVAVTMTLKDKSVSDIPAIQGMLSSLGMAQYDPSVSLAAQLPVSQKGLTEQERTQAEAQLKDWYRELSGYINTPFTGYLHLTLKGKMLLDGHLDESSVQLLIADGSDLVPAESVLPKPSAERTQEGATHMKEILQATTVSGASPMVSYTYDRIAARNYADTWTSNAPGPTYYNTLKWNLQVYPDSSTLAATGGDCVDYVSQALTAGGLPHDSLWAPSPTTSRPPYTSAWRSLSYFLPYMKGKGYLVASNFTSANAGGLRVFLDDTNQHTPYHVVMITKNDLTTRWYSSHTYDEQYSAYGDQANRAYYIVAGS
jgi:hypothetical protein